MGSVITLLLQVVSCSCNSAKKGGDLGEVRPGQMVKSIDNVIFKMPTNKIHGPVKSQFGYHLVEVYFRD